MYGVALGVITVFFVLMLLAGREEVPAEMSSLFRPFYKCAGYLYKRLSFRLPRMFRAKSVADDLSGLYPGTSKEIQLTDYYVKKLALCLVVAVVGSLLGAATKFSAQNSIALINGKVFRGEYPEEEQELQVIAEHDGEAYDFLLQIAPRRLAAEEVEEMFTELLQALPEYILGENESLQQVCFDLNLVDYYEDYPAEVEWKSNHPDIVSRGGKVNAQETPTPVELTVILRYGECSREGKIMVMVSQPILSEEEQRYLELKEMVEESDAHSAEQKEWQLPVLWKGGEISWKQIVEDNSAVVGLGTLVTMFLVYFSSDRDLHEKVEKRRKKMRGEYPEVVHKLVLFVGAGMSIRGAFRRIASEGEGASPIYEEMNYTCHEMGTGVSEGAAYEHFGKRTGLPEYIRLSTLLMQNLKRGNSTLLERLREEADKASEEKLQQSKKLGEEASTKLLLPMVMMLGVVMVMIITPAFSAI